MMFGCVGNAYLTWQESLGSKQGDWRRRKRRSCLQGGWDTMANTGTSSERSPGSSIVQGVDIGCCQKVGMVMGDVENIRTFER